MSSLFNVIARPIRNYISQWIEYFVSKYATGVKLDGLGILDNIIINNININTATLEKELKLPINLKRFQIQEASINIPWLSLLYNPITMKLRTLEIILETKQEMGNIFNKDQIEKNVDYSDSSVESGQEGWFDSIIKQIIANINISIDTAIIKLIHNEKVFVLSIGV